MSDPVGVGVVGFGYWGPRLVRNFHNASTTRTVAICERADAPRARAEAGHPDMKVVAELEELLAMPEVEAVAIATPVETHYALAKQALEADKHVFVEKPFTRTSEQAQELIDLAAERGRVVMVDYPFLYTAAVRKLGELVRDGSLGDLLYIDSIRVNLGLFQPDVDVIWDLAPHDFSILDYVLDAKPRRISTIGASHQPSGHSDVAYVTLDYGDGLLAHLHLNWLAPMKVRQIMVGGSKKMAVYNDMLPDEKIRVYDRGIEISGGPEHATIHPDHLEGGYEARISYRTGDVHAPWLDRTEALLREAETFGAAIRDGAKFSNDGPAGMRVVQLLEAASESLEQGGGFVGLPG
jgi:predicted dehydrogenase